MFFWWIKYFWVCLYTYAIVFAVFAGEQTYSFWSSSFLHKWVPPAWFLFSGGPAVRAARVRSNFCCPYGIWCWVSLRTKRLFAKRHPTWLACWLQSLMSHHDRLFATRKTTITSFLGPVWNAARGRFLLPPPSMELPANRTQVDAFYAGFQAFLENFLVPDCLLYY